MILGNRIRLRALERSDLERCVAWLNDPEVIRSLLIYQPLSMAKEENFFENMLKQPAEEHLLAIEIKVDEEWRHIGNCSFHHVDWKNRSAEVGIAIGEKQHWGKGYGRDALRLMLRHAFNTMNLNRVFLNVFSTNSRAIQSYKNVGFIEEGRLREDIWQDGKYIDALVMSVLRSEWQDVVV